MCREEASDSHERASRSAPASLLAREIIPSWVVVLRFFRCCVLYCKRSPSPSEPRDRAIRSLELGLEEALELLGVLGELLDACGREVPCQSPTLGQPVTRAGSTLRIRARVSERPRGSGNAPSWSLSNAIWSCNSDQRNAGSLSTNVTFSCAGPRLSTERRCLSSSFLPWSSLRSAGEMVRKSQPASSSTSETCGGGDDSRVRTSWYGRAGRSGPARIGAREGARGGGNCDARCGTRHLHVGEAEGREGEVSRSSRRKGIPVKFGAHP